MTDIRLDGIVKDYASGPAATRAVDRVSLEIASGELFFLLGPSGCGKTTLLRIVAGLIEPTAGRVLFNETDVTSLAVEDRQTAMVFQNYALWPHMTVWKNVEFGPRMRGRTAAERRDCVRENLALVQMESYARRRPNQLSGGQQQRVALARALAAGGKCLLLDEPLSNLDARLRTHMRGEIRRLVKATGVTGVYVTHDQKEALSMADRVAVMHAGRVVQIGPPEQLYTRPATRFVADFLGEANFIDAEVVAPGPGGAVRSSAGELRCENLGNRPAGTKLTCSVRPERITIRAASAASPDGRPGLRATVESGTYLGEMRQYHCRLGDGALWKVSVLAGGGKPFEPGQAVVLDVPPEDLAALED